MFRRILVRLILPAVLGVPAGFLALGFALQHESELPGPLLYLLAPGILVADHAVPKSQTFLGPAIGWVLEDSIGTNSFYYFAIFAVGAYLLDRHHSK